MYIQINYEDEQGNNSYIMLEALGPHTIIGCVADVILENYNKKVLDNNLKSIVIGHEIESPFLVPSE